MTTRYHVILTYTTPSLDPTARGDYDDVIPVEDGTSRQALYHQVVQTVADKHYSGDTMQIAVTFFDAQPDTLGGAS